MSLRRGAAAGRTLAALAVGLACLTLLPAFGAARQPVDAPADSPTWVLPPAAGARIAETLGYGERALELHDWRVESIGLRGTAVEVSGHRLADGSAFVATFTHVATPEAGGTAGTLAAQGVIAVAADARDRDSPALRRLAEVIGAAGWVVVGPAVPPSLPPAGQHVAAWVRSSVGAAVEAGQALAGTLLLGLLLVALAVVLQDGAGLLRRRDAWLLLALGVAALALRLALSNAWPSNFVEVERRPLAPLRLDVVYPLLASPLALGARDALAVLGGVSLVLATLGVVALAALGLLWGDRPAAWLVGLAAACDPLLVRFAAGSDAGVGAVGLLALALVATEVVLQRPRVRTALAAGALWALLIHLRPESPTLVLVLAAWGAVDPRLRGLVKDRWIAVALGGPLLASLALDGLLTVVAGAAPGSVTLGQALGSWRAVVVDLLVAPGLRSPLVSLAALAGLAVAPPRVRAVGLAMVVAGVLPVPLGGAWESETDWNYRYVLVALPGLCLLAGFALADAARRLQRRARGAWAGRGALAAAAGLLAVQPWASLDAIARPGLLQAEHAFVARHLGDVPGRAVLLVASDGVPANAASSQVVYRALAAGRAAVATREPSTLPPPRTLVVVDVADPEAARTAQGVPIFYLRGWYEAVRADEGLDDWRRRLEQAFVVTPVTVERVRVAPRRGDEARELPLGLYRLTPRAPAR